MGGIKKVSLPAAREKKGKTGYPLNPCYCVTLILCETGGGGGKTDPGISVMIEVLAGNLRAGEIPV